MSLATGFEWAGLMRAGLRELGLQPRVFWTLTPFELLLMLGREGGGPSMARARLEELARAYPDQLASEQSNDRSME